MKLLVPAALAVSGMALAVSNLDLWSDADADKYQYTGSWLGGDLAINAVDQDESLQLRIKMTGAGSIPQGSSEYFVTNVANGAALPDSLDLIKTNGEWEPDRRQDPRRNGTINIETGDRLELTGVLQTYAFSTIAELVEAANLLNLWTDLDPIPYEYVGSWLGGELNISSIANEDETVEIRVKMTGAGSIPQGQSEYFSTTVDSASALPASYKLLKTDAEWVPDRRQNEARNGTIDLDFANRELVSGVLQTYAFSNDARIVAVEGSLDLWTDAVEQAYSYLGDWLGGTLDINAVDLDEDTLQVRIKMTGAGSIPQGRSEYFVTDLAKGAALPLSAPLTKTDEAWEPDARQNPARNGSIDLDLGNRYSLEGVLQTYSFEAAATEIEE